MLSPFELNVLGVLSAKLTSQTINNSSSLDYENHNREGGFEYPVLISKDFDDFTSPCSSVFVLI